MQPWGATATLIVADDRSYRAARLASSDDPAADSPDRTMLSGWQLDWLEHALLDAQQRGVTWKFVVISSPIQEIGRPSEIGVELDTAKSWAGGYRYERDRLLQFIDRQGIDNVVFLTTDNHYTQINNLRYHAVPGDLLTVRVEGLPAVDYPDLADPAALARYAAQEPRTIIRFQVRAQ